VRNAAHDSYRQLLDLLSQLTATFDEPGRGWTDETTRAEGYINVLDLLSTGLDFFLHNDPDRPHFTQMVSEDRKFGGDNPDALYHFAPLRPDRSYRICGTRGDECYLGFCVYGGEAPGSPPTRVVGNLNHRDLGVGNHEPFEIVVGATGRGGDDGDASVDLVLEADTASVIVRQYFFDREREQPADLSIELIEDGRTLLHPTPPTASFDDIGARLTAVANHVKGWTDLGPLPPPADESELNTICEPQQAAGPWSTPDNLHAYGFYRLAPGEVLELRGRSPECTWWGVQLWNPYLQSYDQRYHTAARNNRQIELEADGSWCVTVAPTDPGAANWLDTAGHDTGFVYFRWQLADEVPPPITTHLRARM
jgi:hypothetical protein